MYNTHRKGVKTMAKDRFLRTNQRKRVNLEYQTEVKDINRLISSIGKKAEAKKRSDSRDMIRKSIIAEAAIKAGCFTGDITKVVFTMKYTQYSSFPEIQKEMRRRDLFKRMSRRKKNDSEFSFKDKL